MSSELHSIEVYHSVELLLLVSMFFLLAIPRFFLFTRETIITLVKNILVDSSLCTHLSH